MESFVDKYSGALTVLILAGLMLGTLLIIVPQLLRARQRNLEMQHTEHMAALEKGQLLPSHDDRSRAAGRTASLVPIVVICAAAIVTCFLSAFKADYVFSVTLAVWSVAGVVSLAAITGGVALMGRLAQLQNGIDQDDPPLGDESRPSLNDGQTQQASEDRGSRIQDRG
jgi:hypothetical protein